MLPNLPRSKDPRGNPGPKRKSNSTAAVPALKKVFVPGSQQESETTEDPADVDTYEVEVLHAIDDTGGFELMNDGQHSEEPQPLGEPTIFS